MSHNIIVYKTQCKPTLRDMSIKELDAFIEEVGLEPYTTGYTPSRLVTPLYIASEALRQNESDGSFTESNPKRTLPKTKKTMKYDRIMYITEKLSYNAAQRLLDRRVSRICICGSENIEAWVDKREIVVDVVSRCPLYDSMLVKLAKNQKRPIRFSRGNEPTIFHFGVNFNSGCVSSSKVISFSIDPRDSNDKRDLYGVYLKYHGAFDILLGILNYIETQQLYTKLSLLRYCKIGEPHSDPFGNPFNIIDILTHCIITYCLTLDYFRWDIRCS